MHGPKPWEEAVGGLLRMIPAHLGRRFPNALKSGLFGTVLALPSCSYRSPAMTSNVLASRLFKQRRICRAFRLKVPKPKPDLQRPPGTFGVQTRTKSELTVTEQRKDPRMRGSCSNRFSAAIWSAFFPSGHKLPPSKWIFRQRTDLGQRIQS